MYMPTRTPAAVVKWSVSSVEVTGVKLTPSKLTHIFRFVLSSLTQSSSMLPALSNEANPTLLAYVVRSVQRSDARHGLPEAHTFAMLNVRYFVPSDRNSPAVM